MSTPSELFLKKMAEFKVIEDELVDKLQALKQKRIAYQRMTLGCADGDVLNVESMVILVGKMTNKKNKK